MTVTLKDVQTMAEDMLGVTLNFVNVRNWVNECQNEYMNPVARLEGYTEITTTPGTTQYNLPSDLFEYSIQLVKHNTTRLYSVSIVDELESDKYQLWDNNICIVNPSETGILKIWYFRKLTDLTIASDQLELPEYRHLYIYYICMKYQQQDEELELENDYASNFYAALQIFENERSKRANRTRRKEWEVRRR